MNDRRRPWWRSPYVVVAAAVFFAAGAITVGSTFAIFSAETDNGASTLASGYIGAPSTPTVTSVSGYDANFSWTPGTHGPVTGQKLFYQDMGTTTTCPASGYTAGPTMASATATTGATTNTHQITTLSAAITTTTATSLTVASSSGFPATPFTIVIDSEQMTVTNVAGTTWTVTRAVNGTTAALHPSGAGVTSLADPYNGHHYCYEMQSTSASNWTATSGAVSTRLGLVPTSVTIANGGTSGTIDKTDVVTLTFNQQTNYPTTSQTVNVCAFSSGVVLLGDTNSCTAATDGYTIGSLKLNGGTVGGNDTWTGSTAIESSSSPWTITVTLGATGNSHKVTLTSPTTWTYTPATSLLSSATTDQAPACTSTTYNCSATTSGGGF